MADLDGDGRTDLVSGSFFGEFYVFRRNSDGTFAAPETLRDPQGENVNTGRASSIFLADWDADGDLDLVAGNTEGKVHVVPNEGTRTKPAWGKPRPLLAGEGEIKVKGGVAGPCVADWDGDGKADLVVGTGAGSVLLHRNVGTREKPALAPPVVLVPEPTEPKKGEKRPAGVPGTRAKPFVVDWNGDGRLDLLFGDVSHTTEEVELTEAQKALGEKARARQKEISDEIAKLSKDVPDDESVEAKTARERRISDLRVESMLASREAAKYRAAKSATHGYVWLLLRTQPVAK